MLYNNGKEIILMAENDKIKWHPGFANALKLEFYDNKNDLEYSEEVVLNKEALKMDMLVIKKKPGIILKNQLGEHFRQYNIIEFKSANDDLNIDTLFKVTGYACLYKSYGKTADAIPFSNITITLIKNRIPKGLFSYIRNHDGTIKDHKNGTYDIIWQVPFPVRIIVNKSLDFNEHTWLAAIRNDLTIAELRTIIEKALTYTEKEALMSIDSAMSVISQANTTKLEIAKREDLKMCKELMELMKPEFDAAVNEAVNEAVIQAVNNTTTTTTTSLIRNLMHNMNINAEQAMTNLGINENDFSKYLPLL